MSGSRRRCCCCNETCPPGAYCTACGQTTDEAATYEAILAGFGSIDTGGGCYGTCDFSFLNGTYALAYTSTVGGVCKYEYSDTLPLDTMDCWPGGNEPLLTILMEVGYGQSSACVCGTTVMFTITVQWGVYLFYWSISASWLHAIDCNDTNIADISGPNSCLVLVPDGTHTATFTKL